MNFQYYLSFLPIISFNSGGIYFSSCFANILSAIKKFLSWSFPSATTPLPSENKFGTVPNLFLEGKGVVAEGKLQDKNFFIADRILAKHDEKYMPPELKDLMKKNVK